VRVSERLLTSGNLRGSFVGKWRGLVPLVNGLMWGGFSPYSILQPCITSHFRRRPCPAFRSTISSGVLFAKHTAAGRLRQQMREHGYCFIQISPKTHLLHLFSPKLWPRITSLPLAILQTLNTRGLPCSRGLTISATTSTMRWGMFGGKFGEHCDTERAIENAETWEIWLSATRGGLGQWTAVTADPFDASLPR
jgi:hypothetical protein